MTSERRQLIKHRKRMRKGFIEGLKKGFIIDYRAVKRYGFKPPAWAERCPNQDGFRASSAYWELKRLNKI